MTRGKYIVIEGHDGTGKSTQVALLCERLTREGIRLIEFHEPEGTPVADSIRSVLKNGSLKRDAETDLLLFTAARHEIWKRAERELTNGTWVVAARNYFSALAYQGYGEGLEQQLITTLTERFTNAAYMIPDHAVILSFNDETERLRRIATRGEPSSPDAFESKDQAFQRRVSEGYRRVAHDYGLPVIDASLTETEISERIYRLIR